MSFLSLEDEGRRRGTPISNSAGSVAADRLSGYGQVTGPSQLLIMTHLWALACAAAHVVEKH